ncbi:MAG: hypothetical protein R6W06_08785 [Prochlorococcaceae cyanobacterium]
MLRQPGGLAEVAATAFEQAEGRLGFSEGPTPSASPSWRPSSSNS